MYVTTLIFILIVQLKRRVMTMKTNMGIVELLESRKNKLTYLIIMEIIVTIIFAMDDSYKYNIDYYIPAIRRLETSSRMVTLSSSIIMIILLCFARFYWNNHEKSTFYMLCSICIISTSMILNVLIAIDKLSLIHNDSRNISIIIVLLGTLYMMIFTHIIILSIINSLKLHKKTNKYGVLTYIISITSIPQYFTITSVLYYTTGNKSIILLFVGLYVILFCIAINSDYIQYDVLLFVMIILIYIYMSLKYNVYFAVISIDEVIILYVSISDIINSLTIKYNNCNKKTNLIVS
jgi:hypothetical protein